MEDQTRIAILRAAERLFADRGFGVSLREIGAAAGQRNHSAVQYHFGTKERLAEALFRYRMEPLNKRRLELIEELRAAGREHDLAALVDAQARPLADFVIANRGDTSYVRFMARLLLSPFQSEPLREEYMEGNLIVARLLREARPELTEQRLGFMILHLVTGLANLELRCEDPDYTDRQARRFVAELMVTLTALLSAPSSPGEAGQGSTSELS